MCNASLRNHLSPGVPGLRHSAACRALSARIPEASITALSAPVAGALGEAPQISAARVIVWSRDRDGSVARVDAHGAATERRALGYWTVVMDDDLGTALRARRNAALPAETGGMLVGVVDTSRQMILLVDALPPPPDSSSRLTEFVRGVLGAAQDLDAVAQITSGMVRYVGEWHTHPAGHSSNPSRIDFEQLLIVRQELSREGLPATMLIVGETDIGIVQLQEAAGRWAAYRASSALDEVLGYLTMRDLMKSFDRYDLMARVLPGALAPLVLALALGIGLEILTRGGGWWVSKRTRKATNHAWPLTSRH